MKALIVLFCFGSSILAMAGSVVGQHYLIQDMGMEKDIVIPALIAINITLLVGMLFVSSILVQQDKKDD